MNPRNKVWLTLVACLLGAVIIACSCGSLSNSSHPQAEPMYGLEGTWQDPKIGVMHNILWDGYKYHVVSGGMANGLDYPVSDVLWNGKTFQWSYYDRQYGQKVLIVINSVDGDQADVWYTTNGAYGYLTFYRVQP
jgi:hypothetical protein